MFDCLFDRQAGGPGPFDSLLEMRKSGELLLHTRASQAQPSSKVSFSIPLEKIVETLVECLHKKVLVLCNDIISDIRLHGRPL